MKILGRVFFVVVTLLLVASLLPTLGVIHAADCDMRTTFKRSRTKFVNVENLQGLSLSVRTNEGEIAPQLRASLIAELHERGVDGVVDNPVAKRRFTMTLEEMSGRWTPFYSTIHMRTRSTVDLKDQRDPNSHSADITTTVDGTCMGLVKKDGWLDAAIVKIADHTVEKMFSKEIE